ncbi:MAG: chemotaxis protein CheC [Candidatus Omnitrophota bacterium]|jgi:chemotaxis protein CheC
MSSLNVTPQQLDVLKEIGNVGAGNAATALGQFFNRKVLITVPCVKLLTVPEIASAEFLSEPNEVGLAVSVNILGSLTGNMLVLFSLKSALSMIDILARRKVGASRLFNVADSSCLSESSNILCCSYLNAVTEFLKLYKLVPSVSQIHVDTMDRLVRGLIAELHTGNAGYILPIENRLFIEGAELNVFVLFLLEQESLHKILSTHQS